MLILLVVVSVWLLVGFIVLATVLLAGWRISRHEQGPRPRHRFERVELTSSTELARSESEDVLASPPLATSPIRF